MNEKSHYLVTFRNPEKLNEHITLKCESICDSSLGLSFVKLEGFVFHSSPILVDPTQDKLKRRYEKTKSLHLSIYNIISIEEVGLDHVGLAFDQDRASLLILNKPDHFS